MTTGNLINLCCPACNHEWVGLQSTTEPCPECGDIPALTKHSDAVKLAHFECMSTKCDHTWLSDVTTACPMCGCRAKIILSTTNDAVKKPNHYQVLEGVESITIIASSMTVEAWMGFCLGNIIKYRLRAGKKDALQQDIDKANYYAELFEMHKHLCRSTAVK